MFISSARLKCSTLKLPTILVFSSYWCDESILRKKGFILVHRFKYNPLWQENQGSRSLKQLATSPHSGRKQATIDTCTLVLS